MRHGESTNWRRRADAKRAETGPELARDAHEIEEREVGGLGWHGPQLPLPQHEPRRVGIPKNQVILQPAVHLRARIQSIEHFNFTPPQESDQKTPGRQRDVRTAMERTGSDGWKLLGPSSQRYPSSGRSTVVMLPPGRARASVTSTSPTPCRVASACAVQRPLIPPPTTTQSADSRAPVEAGASAAPPATAAQRTRSPRRRSLAGLRVPLSSGAAADAAVAMAAAATISLRAASSACAAECG